MRTLGNILWWFPCFGFINSILCFICGGILILTVVGAPLGYGVVQLGKFYLAPFTQAMVSEKSLKANVNHSEAWNTLSTVTFILYIPFGILVCAISILQMIGLCVTIVLIPLAVPIAKSLSTFFNPIGKICVSSKVKDVMDTQEAQRIYNQYQGVEANK